MAAATVAISEGSDQKQATTLKKKVKGNSNGPEQDEDEAAQESDEELRNSHKEEAKGKFTIFNPVSDDGDDLDDLEAWGSKDDELELPSYDKEPTLETEKKVNARVGNSARRVGNSEEIKISGGISAEEMKTAIFSKVEELG